LSRLFFYFVERLDGQGIFKVKRGRRLTVVGGNPEQDKIMGLDADAPDDFIGTPFCQPDCIEVIEKRYTVQFPAGKDRTGGFPPLYPGSRSR